MLKKVRIVIIIPTSSNHFAVKSAAVSTTVASHQSSYR